MSKETLIDRPDDPVITPAVKFLGDVHKRGFNEISLRKYLVEKRGLSSVQINEAFRIHNARLAGIEEDKNSPRVTIVRESIASNQDMTEELGNVKKVQAEPKTKIEISLLYTTGRQEEGQRLFEDFINSEWDYCTKLEFLKNVYYKELAELAEKRFFRLTKEDLDVMFQRIPKLLLVHSFFYNELKRGAHIGHVFVKFFRTFKSYLDYMKDCSSTVRKMSEYVLDKKLHKSVLDIRGRSNPKQDDVIDMLLCPLNRIVEYNQFLEKIWKFADKTEKVKDGYLAKALRKIGKIAKNIERYKYSIFNRNEMNKVQQFLGSQWKILHPMRRVIRRGTMVQQISGWTTKKKNYIFFLFNDLLVWTTTKGELQHIIQLRKWNLMISDSKHYNEKKFKLISNQDKRKTILLECSSKWQRDAWFTAVKIAMKAAKELKIDTSSMSNLFSSAKSNENSSVKARHSRSLSLSLLNRNPFVKGRRRILSDSDSRRESIDTGNGVSGIDDFTYDEHYERSYNLDTEFKELESMSDESDSQTLDYEDEQFFKKYGVTSEKQEAKRSVGQLNPFQGGTPGHDSDESFTDQVLNHEREEKQEAKRSGGQLIPFRSTNLRASNESLTNQVLNKERIEKASEEKKLRIPVSTGGVSGDGNLKLEIVRSSNNSSVDTRAIFEAGPIGMRQEKVDEVSRSTSPSVRYGFKSSHSVIVRRYVGGIKNYSSDSDLALNRTSSYTTRLNKLYTIRLNDLNTTV